MDLKIIITGLGGHGIIFLTRLFAQTAISQGHEVLVSESHGMSQRGGSVSSHLKIGADQAPLIQRGTADLLLALDPDEAVRSLPFLRREGCVFVNASHSLREEVRPPLDRLGIQVYHVEANRLAMELGSLAVANVVLAGFVAAFPAGPFPVEDLQDTIKDRSPHGLEMNLAALQAGLEAGQDAAL